MHRIEGQYHNNNMWTEGPPGTRITASWLNSIQEELIYLLTMAGIDPLTSATDTRDQLYQALSGIFEQAPYISTMTAHETFIASSLYSRRRKFVLDPNGAARNFNPSGTFPVGYEAVVINNGIAFNIVFDSAGSAQTVTPGSMLTSIYDGTNWL